MTAGGSPTPPKLNIKDIQDILPHRYPFLLVDKILDYNIEEGWIIGQKNVTMNEDFFNGHFPGIPIMPGVMVLEAIAQTGGVLIHLKGFRDKIAVLLHVKHARFRRPVRPGDILTIKCRGLHFSSKGGRIEAEAFVDGQLAVGGEVGFALVDRDAI
ncbi:MAG: 3-hydroxyacyl-ACP dehydratase FabZ [Chlamydiia bacterium]|nr:3-hydroxyacyl-ACP dehydratase FabZ [Chlamydiia bacterium]